MTDYLVFPVTSNLKKVTASSAEVARNKYVKDHVAISQDLELIVVPCSHGYKGIALGGTIMKELYKVKIEGLTPKETGK